VHLTITIDTEEDEWGIYRQAGHTVENIKEIPRLQELFDSYCVKPTYLISYPVATDISSIQVLRKIHDQGKCEIGAHCHPWNTPPFEEEMSETNSMLCNLHSDLQYRKIECLHSTIIKNFGIVPKVFRAGRWGYDDTIGEHLNRLRYTADTSVTPFSDWSEYHGPDFSSTESVEPYMISLLSQR